jgi:uncharacterized protein (DUF362 family)
MRGLVDGLEQEVRRELESASNGAGISELIKEATETAEILEKIATTGEDVLSKTIMETVREGSSNRTRSEQVEKIRQYLREAGVMKVVQS